MRLRKYVSQGFKSLILAAAIAFLAGCTSVTRVAYNNLDWLLYREVDKFVDLDKAQRQKAKAALQEFHIWHRNTQLRIYANYLEEFNQQVQAGALTKDDIHARIDILQEYIDSSFNQLLPPAADIIHTLNDKQVVELLKNMRKNREEYEDEYVNVDDEERRENHVKNLSDAIKPWLGRPTKTQRQWIKTWADELEPFEKLNARQQELWEQDVAKILAQRQDKAALQKNIGGLMFYRTDNWQPELEALLDRNQDRTYTLLAKLINQATPKQKEKFTGKLLELREDFLVLSERQL